MKLLLLQRFSILKLLKTFGLLLLLLLPCLPLLFLFSAGSFLKSQYGQFMSFKAIFLYFFFTKLSQRNTPFRSAISKCPLHWKGYSYYVCGFNYAKHKQVTTLVKIKKQKNYPFVIFCKRWKDGLSHHVGVGVGNTVDGRKKGKGTLVQEDGRKKSSTFSNAGTGASAL